MIKITITALSLLFTFLPFSLLANFGADLCKLSQYDCLKVKPRQSWQTLFPNQETRMLIKKVNRMNTPLRAGMTIAVPKNTSLTNFFNLAPFPDKISPVGSNLIKVDLSDLAWAAYNKKGDLVNWGPISGGKNYCADTKSGCKTVTGKFKIYRRQGANCVSGKYPLPNGGAPMPYCMHFHRGYAIHASNVVPGYHASHGCVRLFLDDARWLNRSFIRVGATKVHVVP